MKNNRMFHCLTFPILVAYPVLLTCLTVNAAWGNEAVDFTADIRPIFNRHCVACHGGVKQAGDLSFVYGDEALAYVEAGDPESSYLLERIKSDDDDERMPPPEHGRALNAEEISKIESWIRDGAKWGDHWAYVPPQRSDLSAEEDRWSRTRIDPFILRALRARDLKPNSDASPERWIRRVTLDLVGLPPTMAERQEFLDDVDRNGEAAYGRAVDRLLKSPSFGERWASIWLDAVRYADSRGLGQDGRRTIWKYRDWVIRAFNEDLPYDEFTVRQIAGDLLEDPAIDDLVATASHRLTQTNEEGGTDDEMFRVEAVIDRVNTTWQAWQGVSFGCVQCHSHPYDPIEHSEYYQFLSFFNNTADTDLTNDEPTVAVPLDESLADEARQLDRQIDQLWLEDWQPARQLLGDHDVWTPLEWSEAKTNNSTKVVIRKFVEAGEAIQEYQTRGTVAKETAVIVSAQVPENVQQITAIRFTGLPKDLAAAARDSEWGFVVSHFHAEWIDTDGKTTDIPLAFVVADEAHPLMDPQQSLQAKSNSGFGAYSRIHYPRSAAFVLDQPIDVPEHRKIRISIKQNVFELGAFPLVAHRGRLDVSDSPKFTDWWNAAERVENRQRVAEYKKRRGEIPSVRIPVMRERSDELARPSYVFDRGNYLTKIDAVTSGIPEFLKDSTGISYSPSNRLELAQWIGSTDNPLTARVAVNRFWGVLFGTGLVETQEDFGSSGALPSHPALLDDLAARFQSDMNWSTKQLLRELVLSSTYRQSSLATDEKIQADPRNRLLSRGPRGRLPAEVIRDQALAISGLLSPKMYGPPVHPPIPEGVWKPFQGGDKWNTPPPDDADRYRRSVYTYTKRSIPYPALATFDAPSREFCAVRRLPSNTPLQALMMLNDVTFHEAAAALASRMNDVEGGLESQLAHGFLLATCRQPSDAEMNELRGLYHAQSQHGHEQALETIASVLMNLDEVLSQ